MMHLMRQPGMELINTRRSVIQDEVFMEICGDEDWMPQYENTVWPPEESTMVTTGEDETRDDVDSAERVKIRYNGMSQWTQRSCNIQQHGCQGPER